MRAKGSLRWSRSAAKASATCAAAKAICRVDQMEKTRSGKNLGFAAHVPKGLPGATSHLLRSERRLALGVKPRCPAHDGVHRHLADEDATRLERTVQDVHQLTLSGLGDCSGGEAPLDRHVNELVGFQRKASACDENGALGFFQLVLQRIGGHCEAFHVAAEG